MKKAGNSYRTRLTSELILRQRKNPAYSLRSFARDLGISPASLSQALNAKRSLSKANLNKVCDKLRFSPSEKNAALLELSGSSGVLSDDQFTTLHEDVFRFMADWFYFAILSLAETGPTKSDSRWIARKLGITEIEAKDAVDRLLRLNMIEVHQGMIHYDGTPLRTTTDVPSSAARSLQHSHLRLAAVALEQENIERRDMTSMTMAIRPERITQAKGMIKTFRRRISKFLEEGGGSEVYVMAVQLFPVTQRDAL